MKTASASSVQTDAYRAGAEVGERLRSIRPEVVILFSSIHYAHDFPGLFEGLRDGLDLEHVLFFGGTGDGIYETARVADQGISALALNSEGRVRWAVAVEPGVIADSYTAARRCGERAQTTLGGTPDFAFVMADGKADGSRLTAGFRSAFTSPFIGGLAGDDRTFARTYVFADGQAHYDAAAVLLGRGKINWLMNASSGWKTVGEPGVIEAAHGNVIERISNTSALDFMRAQMGKSPGEVDLGIIPLASPVEGAPEHISLRAVSRFDPVTGALTMVGGMELGARVHVCNATRAEVVQGVDDALAGLRDLAFKPVAALVVSCFGRKWVMGDRGQEELVHLRAVLGKDLAVAGFPSFGEIAPFRKPGGTYTATQFHNVTFAVCLIGA